jgi:predicted NAD-dependent protein-ADP-ribosyltransferase YbiA (DUF1768 family)
MEDILLAKYSQCEEAKQVLLNTGNAILLHGVPRGKPMRMIGHEKVREKLSE